MKTRTLHSQGAQRGVVLVSSLLLLLVVTILAVAIFRNFGLGEKIAGNQREKQRALHAAESAQQYAEWWLTSGTGVTTPVVCNAVLAAPGAGQVCANVLPLVNTTNLVWPAAVTYAPPNMQFSVTGGPNKYVQTPQFYISYLGTTADSSASNYKLLYQVDAVGYGGTQNAVAVVESTYYVTTGVCNLGVLGGC